MVPEAVCTAGTSQEVIGVEVSLKSKSSSTAKYVGELPLLSVAVEVGEADDSCGYTQLNLRNEQ